VAGRAVELTVPEQAARDDAVLEALARALAGSVAAAGTGEPSVRVTLYDAPVDTIPVSLLEQQTPPGRAVALNRGLYPAGGSAPPVAVWVGDRELVLSGEDWMSSFTGYAAPLVLWWLAEELDGLSLKATLEHIGGHAYLFVGSNGPADWIIREGRILAPESEASARIRAIVYPRRETQPIPLVLLHNRKAIDILRSTGAGLTVYGLSEEVMHLYGPEALAKALRRETERLASLAAGAPTYFASLDPEGRLAGDARRALEAGSLEASVGGGLTEAHIEALRSAQAVADDVYGRLEVERAIAWTVEELGELSNAIRSDEGSARISEELGQVFAWTLCLANITDTDLAEAARGAVAQEVERSYAKYGGLHPYRRAKKR
jgi:NTP pyrophosphatase (non-canonical NTP hydrolase)